MKKIGITLAVCAILFTANGLAQNTNVPYLIKESLRKNAAQLKSGIVGSYPRHTEVFNWDTNWILYRTIETSYTSFGEPSAIEYTQGANKNRDLYSYDAQHNQTERQAQNWTGGAWVDSERWTSTYNASGYETETRHEQWNGTSWDLKDGTQSAFTMDGNQISVVTMKTWNAGTNTWDNSLRNTYTYTGSGANFATVVMEEWTTQWVFTIKTEYTWSGNQVSQWIIYDYQNGEWKRSSKYVYEHPDSNTTVMTISMDDEAGGWTETSRITTTVDSHGNTTLNQMEIFMGTWTIYTATRFQLTYAGNNLTQRITEEFSFGSDWANTLKEVFSNFASLSTDITLMPDSGLSVFPNPAGKEAIVRLSLLKAGSVTLSVVSMTGQEILKETISANGSDVNYQLNLKGVRPGSYILIARDKQGVEVGKTRFIKDKE